MNETSKHRQELWRRFTKSGSVSDYLAYRGIPAAGGIQAADELQAVNGIQAAQTAIRNSDQSQIP